MFFLLYRHTDDGVIDDFPKISDHFPKIPEDSAKFAKRLHECCQTFSEDVRRSPKITKDYQGLPNTFEEDPKMFRSYTKEFIK